MEGVEIMTICPNLTEGFEWLFHCFNIHTGGSGMSIILAIIWGGIVFGLYMYQRDEYGRGDFQVSFGTGSLINFFLALLLFINEPKLINEVAFGISLGAMVLGVAFLFFTSKN